MTNYEAETQWHDPTAQTVISGSNYEPGIPVAKEPLNFGPREFRLKEEALAELNRRFPKQAKKRWQKQDPLYRSLLEEICLGNFDVLNQTRKGGVNNGSRNT